MQVFQQRITVTKDHIDELNHVNNIQYLQWVQDIAKAHWLQNASKTILEEYYWVVLSHTIEYKGQAFLNDELFIKTFVSKSQGVTSTRIVEIYHNDTQKLLAKCETNWCLLLKSTKKPSRITPVISKLFS